MQNTEPAFHPADIITEPGPEYADEERLWQGIPGIERAPGGRLWACWYSGGEGEGPDNYVVLATSADDGAAWKAPALVVHPPADRVRAYDPVPWVDPQGPLWVFWAQSQEYFDGRAGVWCICTEDPDAENPAWSDPQRVANGIMMNKPIVSSKGEWLLPTAVWEREPHRPELAGERLSNVTASTDQGGTWEWRGGADVPERSFDEHMVVELQDGRLWMLVRTKYGIGQSFSGDDGRTWTPGEDSGIPGPCSRFHIRRLASGRLLLINHYKFTKRSHMTALLSDDDGKTWQEGLLLDERAGISYPDATEAPDGTIYAVYDHNRGDHYATGNEKEVLLAVFTEEDILAGQPTSDKCRLKVVVNRAKKTNPASGSRR